MPRSWRLPVVLVAAFVIAEGAVLLMRPRDLGPDPAPVTARAYFSADQLERAREFRRPQTRLGLAQTGVGLLALALFVRRPPRRLTDLGRPLVAGAATAAAVTLAAGLAPLPLRAIARERAKDAGLVTQYWSGWVADVAKAEAISACFAAAGGALLVLGMRRFGRRWWLPGAGVAVAFAVATTYAGPVLLDPLFHDFKRLPPGELRADVLALAAAAGVDVGEVYELDASRRTVLANAYVGGIGQTKRIVLYDNLLRDFTPQEVRLVVAHELGHQRHHDLRNGLIWVALVAPAGMLAAARLGERLAPGGAPLGPRAVPAVVLSVALVAPALTIVSNQLSRAVERRADAFSLELTNDPDAFVALQRRLVRQNLSDPDPPALTRALLGTHPTALERIGAAVSFRARGPRAGAEHRPPRAAP